MINDAVIRTLQDGKHLMVTENTLQLHQLKMTLWFVWFGFTSCFIHPRYPCRTDSAKMLQANLRMSKIKCLIYLYIDRRY